MKKVGAISNIKNPIMVSLTLLEAQLKGTENIHCIYANKKVALYHAC